MTCDQDENVDTTHIRVLPDTCAELFVNYTSTPVAIIDNELHERSIITFRMSRPMDVQMRKGTGCLAICFHPGMAYNFFHVPMHVVTDTTVALSDLWKDMAAELEEKLFGPCDNETRVGIVQRHLLQQLAWDKQDSHIIYCLKQVQCSGGLIPVSELTNATGLSQRHLSRKFQQCVGLSPKEYLRVSRFIRSLQYLKEYPVRSLTEVGYESGYYDQSHFIRDYNAFTGHTPREVVHARYIFY